ncbi:cation transporter [Neobacillus sp. LXY-1]|uniref:cation transporter n=1 Tax=Neobacillus sp. LXY-1 TaxID=3379133 RepID=UPI003EDF1E45
MDQVTVYVMGICCLNSIQTIEQKITSMRGIISFKGLLPKGKIVIKFKPSLVNHMKIIHTIEEHGFAIAKLVHQEQNKEIYD